MSPSCSRRCAETKALPNRGARPAGSQRSNLQGDERPRQLARVKNARRLCTSSEGPKDRLVSMTMPSEDVLAIALVFLGLGLVVGEYVTYRRMVRKLGEQGRWESLRGSSRWVRFRVFWGVDERGSDPALRWLSRQYRVITIAYAVVVVAAMFIMTLILLPPMALPAR